MKLRIADLYPLEPSVVRSCLEKHQRKIRAGEALVPIEVIRLGHDWLVTNGCNRVVAAMREGLAEIEAAERHLDDPSAAEGLRATLEYRKNQAGMKGFADIPMTVSRSIPSSRAIRRSDHRNLCNAKIV